MKKTPFSIPLFWFIGISLLLQARDRPFHPKSEKKLQKTDEKKKMLLTSKITNKKIHEKKENKDSYYKKCFL